MTNLYVAIFCLFAALANVPFWPEKVPLTLSLINFLSTAANLYAWWLGRNRLALPRPSSSSEAK